MACVFMLSFYPGKSEKTKEVRFIDTKKSDVLLLKEEKENIEAGNTEYFFVKSERRYFKINYKDILFIEGLKDYVIIQLDEQRVITRMNLKNIFELLPKHDFLRVNKSYIVNTKYIDSFDNNDIFIKTHEIAIGNTYRDAFFEAFMRMG